MRFITLFICGLYKINTYLYEVKLKGFKDIFSFIISSKLYNLIVIKDLKVFEFIKYFEFIFYRVIFNFFNIIIIEINKIFVIIY